MIETTTLFRAFEKVNVLIVGDVMLDRYLWGEVSRISPEAPVPVVRFQGEENRLGGAANVALNVQGLGATAYLCGVVGKDENAAHLLELLPQTGLFSEGILQSEDRMTTVKTRVVAGNQHLLRVDREDVKDLSHKLETAFLENIRFLLETKDIHVILFQDYNKGVLSKRVIQSVILEARERAIPTAVDPKNRNFWEYRGVQLFKPNLKEVQNGLRRTIAITEASLSEASAFICRKLSNELTMITLSEKGLFIYENDEGKIIPTRPRSITDVCGAGDAVISVAALGLASSMGLEELAVLANLAGGQVCEKVGVVPVDKKQLKVEFKEYSALW
jgi:D-glycero-beta-D-manno-heptose-7-phosphate kinase